MSIQLSQGEKIVREYNYGVEKKGLSKKMHKSFILTNKRIIQRDVGEGIGSETVSNREIPVKSADYINVSYGKKSKPFFLLLAILCFCLAFIFFSVVSVKVAGLIFLLAAGLFIVLYIFMKKYSLSCSISHDGRIIELMSAKAVTHNSLVNSWLVFSSFGLSKSRTVVNHDVALKMTEEFGGLIGDIKKGLYD